MNIFPAVPHRLINKHAAFTLIEMIVAMSVLVLIVALMYQLFTNAASSTVQSQKNLDSVAQAQLVLDRISVDFAQMPLRRDIDYSFLKASGNDSFSFYSVTKGLYPEGASNPRGISILEYRVSDQGTPATPQLDRGARQLDWSPGGPAGEAMHFIPMSSDGSQTQQLTTPNTLPAVEISGKSNRQIFGDQVFRMEICFLTKGDWAKSPAVPPKWVANPPASISEIATITVTIAILDNKSRLLVKDYTALIAALPDAQDGQDTLALWNAKLSDPQFLTKTNLPLPAAQSVQLFQKTYELK